MVVTRENVMVELLEALAIEKAKRARDTSEGATRQELRKVVLLGRAVERERGSQVAVSGRRRSAQDYLPRASHSLVLRGDTTEWITGESFEPVIDQAVRMTAKLIVDTEAADDKQIAYGGASCQPRGVMMPARLAHLAVREACDAPSRLEVVAGEGRLCGVPASHTGTLWADLRPGDAVPGKRLVGKGAVA
jgi:hypothetical protein